MAARRYRLTGCSGWDQEQEVVVDGFKLVRERTGLGLKEAKELVERQLQ